MNKLTLTLVAATAIAWMNLGATTANAQFGFGIYTYSPNVYPIYTTNYPTTVYPVTPIYGGGGYHQIDNNHVWHDESHLDYVPARIVRHGNHFDVVPGHYRVHRTGHLHHLHD